MLHVKNNAYSQLAASISDTDNSLTLIPGGGAGFPDTTPFHITIDDEILEVTGTSGDTFTVTRQAEDTVAAAHTAGALVKNNETAEVIKELQTSTTTLQDITNNADSPMVTEGATLSAGTNAGTLKVGALTALLRTTDSETGELVKVTKAEEDNIAFPATDTTYFVSLNYNGGTPTISLVTTSPYDADKRNIPIGRAMNDSADGVHFLNGGFRFQDGVKKTQQRAQSLRNIELGKGSTIAYLATNNFTMSAGQAFAGINRILLDAYDSSAETNTPIYSNGATFIYGTDRNTIDYLHFDNQDGTLGDVGNGKYGVFWIYKHSDDQHVFTRYGISGSYTLAQAEASTEPPKPDHLTEFGCLIGRIIVPQAGGEFTEISMVTDSFFTGTAVSDHNLLGNLQGGAVDEYYHLTNTEHTGIFSGSTPKAGGEVDFQNHSAGFTEQVITSSSGSATIDWRNGNDAVITLTENTTITFTAPSHRCHLQLRIIQDSTGGYTITLPTIKYPGGTAPTFSTAANSMDILNLFYDGTDYEGQASLNFS